MPVSIKISEENYGRLSFLSGKLREMLYRPVSLNETISFLYNRRRLSDLAGSWKMNDKDAELFLRDVKRGWKEWKIKSV